MYSFGPIAFLVGIAYAVITLLIDFLTPLTGAGAAPALAIVVLTVVVRAALIPVGRSQVRAEYARRRLAPKLTELRRRHKNNPQRLQEATVRLYREEGTSPLAGCLPALLQAPVFIAVYGLFLSTTIDGEANHLLSAPLGGVALGDRLPDVLGDPAAVALFAGLTVVLAAVGWFQRRTTPAPVEPEGAGADMMVRLTRYLPFLVLLAVPVVPLAAVVYLATTTTWTVVERVTLRRLLRPRMCRSA